MSHRDEELFSAQAHERAGVTNAKIDSLRQGLRENDRSREKIDSWRQEYERIEERHRVIRDIRTSYRSSNAERYE